MNDRRARFDGLLPARAVDRRSFVASLHACTGVRPLRRR
jgi:hypothetical protein